MTNASRNLRRLFWAAPFALLLIAGAAVAAMMMQPPPKDLDLSLSKPTENGRYVSTVMPGLSPLAIGPIHSWTVEIKTPDGHTVDAASITVDGGMPQHGHGLPTTPRVTQNLGKGRYLIEGMKFNMPGWWIVTVHIDGPAGPDQATFNLTL